MFSALRSRIIWVRHSSLMRLTLLFTAIFTLAFLLVAVVTVYLVDRQTLVRIDAELQATASQIDDLDDIDLPPGTFAFTADRKNDLPRPIGRIRTSWDGFATLDQFEFRGEKDWRVLVIEQDDEWIAVIKSLADREDVIETMTGVYAVTAGVALVLVIGLGIWIATKAQRRFSLIKLTLEDLAKGDLKARVGLKHHDDDIGALASALDKTADQLERLVAQTRNLGANIAHDLRTPLARMSINLQQAQDGDTGGLDRAFDDLDRLSSTFDAIMRIARIEANRSETDLAPVDLGDLATTVSELFSPVLEDEGKTLALKITSPATIAADKDLLIQALGNLIQNARVYGGDQVTLFVNGTNIGVSDNGQGVPDDMLDKIIQPMVRLDKTRQSDGAGLGLSMVGAVADRHDATLTLRNLQPSGLEINLNFAKM